MSDNVPLTLPAAAAQALCRELPRAPDFAAALQTIERVRQDLLGDGLLTVNHVRWPAPPADAPDAIDLQRIWSSRPAEYPVAGRKRKGLTPWTRQLLLCGEIFIGEGQPALQQVFDDSPLILSLGLRSVMNVPLLRAGACFATFNVLGTRPQWTALEKQQIELLAALALPWVAGHGAA